MYYYVCITYPEAPSFSRVSLERRTLTSLKTSLNSPGGECKIKSDAILTCIKIDYSFKIKILSFSRPTNYVCIKNYLLLTSDHAYLFLVRNCIWFICHLSFIQIYKIRTICCSLYDSLFRCRLVLMQAVCQNTVWYWLTSTFNGLLCRFTSSRKPISNVL